MSAAVTRRELEDEVKRIVINEDNQEEEIVIERLLLVIGEYLQEHTIDEK